MKNKYSKLRLDKTESILVKMFEDLILDTLHERISREEKLFKETQKENQMTITKLNKQTKTNNLKENVLARIPFLSRLNKLNKLKTNSGRNIVQPVYVQSEEKSPEETIDNGWISTNNGIICAEFDWKTAKVETTITLDEMNKIDLILPAKLSKVEDEFVANLNYGIFNNIDNGAPTGLGLICSDKSLGGLPSSTPNWKPLIQKVEDITFKNILDTINSLHNNSYKPTVAYTTKAIFDMVFTSMYTTKANFQNIMVGGIPLIVHDGCPENTVYILNENYLSVSVHKDVYYKFDGFVKPVNRDVLVGKFYLMCAITCSDRSKQCILTVG